jgi:hypothetical protein
MYLDCFFYGAMLGDQFPVNSYGPATISQLETLKARVGHNFDRMEFNERTKGMNPLPADLWPGVERPR